MAVKDIMTLLVQERIELWKKETAEEKSLTIILSPEKR
jgi:hypothetical protein